MKIKKNDTVLIISGRDRGRTGKVLAVSKENSKIMIEGINIKKKHVKPKKQGEKGQVVQIPAFMSASNVKVVCSKCNKATRIGYKVEGDKKYRLCKKCNQEI
jgi:large subunit ribosomal protein L24